MVPELNLGQMVREVERAAGGQAQTFAVGHAGGSVHRPEHILEAIVEASAMSDADSHIANPVEQFLRMDRMPHIWCPGCGIGTTVNCFARALIESEVDMENLAIVSGIGCTGRVAGYIKLDSFHTTHGRAIPFATGLKLANPKLNVVVYCGDGDLFAIGGNHLIHAARRNLDLKVICVNNLIYAMTGGQTAPTTPGDVDHLHQSLRHLRSGVQSAPPGRSRRRRLRRALDDLPREAARALDAGDVRRRKASASSKSSRPARRSISGATRWATASTP